MSREIFHKSPFLDVNGDVTNQILYLHKHPKVVSVIRIIRPFLNISSSYFCAVLTLLAWKRCTNIAYWVHYKKKRSKNVSSFITRFKLSVNWTVKRYVNGNTFWSLTCALYRVVTFIYTLLVYPHTCCSFFRIM